MNTVSNHVSPAFHDVKIAWVAGLEVPARGALEAPAPGRGVGAHALRGEDAEALPRADPNLRAELDANTP